MNKWHGSIGFAEQVETRPGVYVSEITDRKYFGDIMQNIRHLESGDKVNDDLNVANKISIVADPYARQNFHSIVYAEFMGTFWKVSTIEEKYPRLILSLGGEWNG